MKKPNLIEFSLINGFAVGIQIDRYGILIPIIFFQIEIYFINPFK